MPGLSLRLFLAFSFLWVSSASVVEFAHASDGSRKVTRTHYDGLGRTVKSQVYDDRDDGLHLVSEGETEYDQLNNVTRTVQKRVNYDQDGDGTVEPVIAAYAEIENRALYEDTNWPTKPTHIYNPRYAHIDEAAQRDRAQQIYYDRETGLPELVLSSAFYCTHYPSSNANLTATSETFAVERGGADVSVEVQRVNRCAAMYTKYDEHARVTRQMLSQDLYRGRNRGYDTMSLSGLKSRSNVEGRSWLISEMSYYDYGDVQKGSLRDVTAVGSVSVTSRISHFDWDEIGNLSTVSQVIDPNSYNAASFNPDTQGQTARAEYDVLRRVVKTFDAEGGEAAMAFDPAGRLRAISSLLSPGEWAVQEAEYYKDSRIKSVTDPDGDVISYNYDAAGRVDVTTDPDGRKTKTLYYPNGATKCTIRGFGSALQQAYAAYDYAVDGQVVAQRPAKGSDPNNCEALNDTFDTSFVYDGYRRLFQTTYPKRDNEVLEASLLDNGHSYTRAWYDRGSLVTQTRSRKGDLTKLWYDVTGNNYVRRGADNEYHFSQYGSGTSYLVRIRPKLNDDASLPLTSGSYDTARRHQISTPLNALGEQYYELSAEWGSPTLSTTPFFNALGNLQSITYHGGAKAEYSHDKRGAITGTSYRRVSGAALEQIGSAQFDLAGRMTQMKLGQVDQFNADDRALFGRQTFNYDADGDLKQIGYGWGANTTSGIWGPALRYDQNDSGQITKAYFTNGAWRHTPTQAKVEDYGVPNALDQYQSVNMDDGQGVRSFSYDGNGNLTSDGAGRNFTYNSENQMIRATGTNPNTNTAFDMSYRYDGLGRRIFSLDNLTGTETYHEHFGDMEVADYGVTRDAGGTITNFDAQFRVILGTGVDSRLGYHDVQADALTYPFVNHQGSTIAMMDESGNRMASAGLGAIVYDPYGNQVKGSLEGYPYRYTGRRYDAQTGLYYYRARYYDPATGRFLQTDPIGYADQMNLYAYVNNDPVNFTDPTGERMHYQWTSKSDLTIWVPIFVSEKASDTTLGVTEAEIQARVSADYDGSYTYTDGTTINVTVDFEIVKKSDHKRGHINKMKVKSTNEREYVYLDQTMVVNNKTTAGIISHEVGHLMKADDHYERYKDSSGRRRSRPDPGWSGNLMADPNVVHSPNPVPGSIDQRNLDEIFDGGPKTETCMITGDKGRCK